MANLGEITGELPEIAVPPGFAITAAAYERFLSHNQLTDEINRRLQSMEEQEISDLYRKSAEIQTLIMSADLPPELAEAISQAYADLASAAGGAVKVALRSSAIGEDAADTSSAGQYHSELNVSADNLHAVYKEVLASKYALTAVSYRLHKGLRDEDVAMCVGCMAMVDSACGGVMYSRDPTDIRRTDLSQRGPRAGQIRGGRNRHPGFVGHLPGRAPDHPPAADPGQGTEGRVPPGRKGCAC